MKIEYQCSNCGKREMGTEEKDQQWMEQVVGNETEAHQQKDPS